MSYYKIPATNEPQTFSIVLAGVNYQLTTTWNYEANSWTLDIADSQGNPIVNGIALVAGADLLGPYAYLNFGGSLFVLSDSGNYAIPTFSDLGTGSKLIFKTTP